MIRRFLVNRISLEFFVVVRVRVFVIFEKLFDSESENKKLKKI